MATGQTQPLILHLRRAGLLRQYEGMTNGQLLESFSANCDEAAFEVLVRRHGPTVLGVCRRVLGNLHDAEDAFQATFLVLVRKATSVGQPELLGNWLYGVAYRTALEAKTVIAQRRAREREVREMPDREAPAEDPWRELQPVLDRELSQLPDKYRVPVVLCDLEGKTRKEAARRLGVPEGTLSTRLARARAMLAKRLARHGLSLSGGTLAAALSPNAASAALPTPLVVSTARAAALMAAGQAAGLISAEVAALTEGVLKSMLNAKLKTVLAVALVVTALAGAGSGWYIQRGVTAAPSSGERATSLGQEAGEPTLHQAEHALRAQEPATVLEQASPVRAEEIPPAYRDTVAKGLRWLAREQHREGHWATTQDPDAVATTSLAAMALLLEGSTVHDGTYADNLRRATTWLLSRSQRSNKHDGLICLPDDPKEAGRHMLGHALALEFISQVYCNVEDEKQRQPIQDVLSRAVKFAVAMQSRHGGWLHASRADAGDSVTDSVVTVFMLTGLREARNAGLPVPRDALKNGLGYLEKATGSRGGVGEALGADGKFTGRERPVPTAGALHLHLRGDNARHPLVAKYLKFCHETIAFEPPNFAQAGELAHYFYAQVMGHLGNEGFAGVLPDVPEAQRITWERYRTGLFDHLKQTQSKDGSWSSQSVGLGPVSVTALHLSTLQTASRSANPDTAVEPPPLPQPKDPDDFLWLLEYSKARDKLNPRDKTRLESLEWGKVPTAREAEKAASTYKSTVGGGLDAEEGPRVVGLVRVGVDVPSFADRGDLVWIVRITHTARGVTQEMWISSTSGAIRTVLPGRAK